MGSVQVRAIVLVLGVATRLVGAAGIVSAAAGTGRPGGGAPHGKIGVDLIEVGGVRSRRGGGIIGGIVRPSRGVDGGGDAGPGGAAIGGTLDVIAGDAGTAVGPVQGDGKSTGAGDGAGYGGDIGGGDGHETAEEGLSRAVGCQDVGCLADRGDECGDVVVVDGSSR